MSGLRIYYDGACFFCRHYVRLQRLRAVVGEVELVDLRTRADLAGAFKARGLDVDDGMIVEGAFGLKHGADAVHALALLTSPVTPFNIAVHRILRHRKLAGILYPLLRAGRALSLRLAGKGRILD